MRRVCPQQEACSLFGSSDTRLLEWLDDNEHYALKGCGRNLNYAMATPLLKDIHANLMQAARTHPRRSQRGWDAKRAHLRFAHAETLEPLLCLLGFFRANTFHGGFSP